MVDAAAVAANVDQIRQRIHQAGGSDAVQLLAVTKTFPVGAMLAAHAAGCCGVGENYAQELVAKAAELVAFDAALRPEVHFIGHLQSNKVRQLAQYVSVWQTLDRPSVIDEVAHRAPGARVMMQVNVTGEPQKSGCSPGDLSSLIDRAVGGGLDVIGLMTLGVAGDEASSFAGFTLLARLADEFGVIERSMGMSGDLDAAVRAGSTMVRVGSALFGSRDRQVNS
jgi:PLP dependent protein